MNKREIDWSGKEEGEAELLCYECGADFRTRSYFLRHRRAHRNAEICGMLMTEDSCEDTCVWATDECCSVDQTTTCWPNCSPQEGDK